MKAILLAATLLTVPMMARAQPIQGLYVGAGAGANFLQEERVRVHTGPLAGPTIDRGYDTGLVALGSVGWGFGNGVRLEAEGSWRNNHASGGSERKYGAMGNVLFDMDIGSPWVFPYLGAGAGAQWVRVRDFGATATDPAFAYQAMLGVAIPIPGLVGLSATAEYRYLGVSGKRKLALANGVGANVSDDNNHSLMLGLRYAFNVPAPALPAAAAPPPAAAPAPAPARSYLVFFDWDSAALNARAQQIVDDAAANVPHVQNTRLEVSGHADRTGTEPYNMALSRRRAEAVAAELVAHGVAKAAISIQAFGDTKPLVPTAAGVREPQNRRVEIIIR